MPALFPESSVYPAPAASSAAESVVGTATWGRPRAARAVRSASLTASILAVSIGLPPPKLTIPSTCATSAMRKQASTCAIGACWLTTTVTATRASPRACCTTLMRRSSATNDRVVTSAMRWASNRVSSWPSPETEPGPQWMVRGLEYAKSPFTAWSYYGRHDLPTQSHACGPGRRPAGQGARRDDPAPWPRRLGRGHHDRGRRAHSAGLCLSRSASRGQCVVSESLHRPTRVQRALPQLGARDHRNLAGQGRRDHPGATSGPPGVLAGRLPHAGVCGSTRPPVWRGGRA